MVTADETNKVVEELRWEQVRRPLWLQIMVSCAMAFGYALRGTGWIIEHLGQLIRYLGREMVLSLQRLDYPETQSLTDEQKRMLAQSEPTEDTAGKERRQ